MKAMKKRLVTHAIFSLAFLVGCSVSSPPSRVGAYFIEPDARELIARDISRVQGRYSQAAAHVLELVDKNKDNSITYDEALLGLYAMQKPINQFYDEIMALSEKDIPKTIPDIVYPTSQPTK